MIQGVNFRSDLGVWLENPILQLCKHIALAQHNRGLKRNINFTNSNNSSVIM